MKALRFALALTALAAASPIATRAQGGGAPSPQPPAGAFADPSQSAAQRAPVPAGAQGSPAQLPPSAGPGGEAPGAPAPQPFEAWRFNARERTVRGLAAWKNEKPAEAVGALDTAARLRPDDPLATYNSGTAHLGAGLTDAEPILERALQSAPAELAADGYYNLGNARLAAKNPAGAIDSYKETLRRSPGNAGARRNLEIALKQLEEQQKQQQQQQKQNDDSKNQQQQKGGSKDKSDPNKDPQQGDPKDQQQPSPGDSGDRDDPSKQGANPQQGAGSQKQSPLPQFKDQKDMTAEQAAAILQAVDNLERERRREEAKERARVKTNVEKDW